MTQLGLHKSICFNFFYIPSFLQHFLISLYACQRPEFNVPPQVHHCCLRKPVPLFSWPSSLDWSLYLLHNTLPAQLEVVIHLFWTNWFLTVLLQIVYNWPIIVMFIIRYMVSWKKRNSLKWHLYFKNISWLWSHSYTNLGFSGTLYIRTY